MAKAKDPEVIHETEIPEADYEELVSIRLPLTKENQADMFVRVNQRTWLIKRGVTVQVPRCVAMVIENSERAMLEGMAYQQAHEKNG